MSTSWLLVILVVIWLFVLAPLVVNKRKPIRKTSAALSETRVLHRGGEEISATKRRPSFSASDVHDTDEVDESLETVSAQFDDDFDPDEVLYDDTQDDASEPEAPEVVDGDVVYELEAGAFAAEDVGIADSETGDAAGVASDVDSAPESSDSSEGAQLPGKQPAAASEKAPTEELGAEVTQPNRASDEVSKRVQYQQDFDIEELNYQATHPDEDDSDEAAAATDVTEPTSQVASKPAEVDEIDDSLSDDDIAFAHRRRGRGGFDPDADALYAQTRFARRRRSVAGLAVAIVVTAIVAVVFGGWTWALPAVSVALMALYLINLRRTVREEAELRARRIRRMKMARLGVRHQDDDQLGIPERLRRPGAVVLELDDEDPDFHDLPLAEIPKEDEDYRREAV